MSRHADSRYCPTCQCTWGDSNCVHFSTRGPNDPWYAEFILDDDDGQLAECSHNGFGVFAPTWLSDPPAVSAYHSVTQSVPYDTVWPLLFNKEYYDTDSMHDTALEASSRLTFNTAGIYLVTLNTTWQKKTVSEGDLAGFIRRDSADYIAIESTPSLDSDGIPALSVKYQGFFESGQYVEALVKQDMLDTDGNPMTGTILTERYSPIFSAIFLRLEP